MPRGGSKPGQRRGGRKPGTPNKPKGQQLIVADWAYGIAKKYAPNEDDKGRLHWGNEGDEVRFMRFLNFCGRCAAARAQFESPKYAAIAVATQGEKTPEIYKRDPAKVMDDMVARFIAAREAERAESVIDVTPEPEPAKPEPEEGVDGEMA